MIDIELERRETGEAVTIRVIEYSFDKGLAPIYRGHPDSHDPGCGPTAEALDIKELLGDGNTKEVAPPLDGKEWDDINNQLLDILVEGAEQ